VAPTRAAIAAGAVGLVALALLSGGTRADPRTPRALPGLPPPFLGTAVIGGGGRSAAIDAYGDVVGLWAPGPAGRSLIHNPADRQAAGTVPADTGVIARMPGPGGRGSVPLWQADSVSQRYLPGTNVLRTSARVGSARVKVVVAARTHQIGCLGRASAPGHDQPRIGFTPRGRLADLGFHCGGDPARRIVHEAVRSDRRWLARARPLGAGAPRWAGEMYRRSLLVLRALTDRRSGAVAAGAREGWAYVWPRDASAVAIALASAGYRAEARRVARFLLGLDLDAAARFRGTGEPVGGRAGQGDVQGWAAAAAGASGVSRGGSSPRSHPEQCAHRAAAPGEAAAGPRQRRPGPPEWWRGRADYQEGDSGDYLGNALASTAIVSVDGSPSPGRLDSARRLECIRALFGTPHGLVREAKDPGSGLDSTAAWAVRPFPHPALFPLAERPLLRLASQAPRYGIAPSEGWTGGEDPWTAPTAWSAWGLAALANAEPGRFRTHPRRFRGTARRFSSPARRFRGTAERDRRAALRLIADLRRAATPLGLLPERVDARSGAPRSTTPLAWSHAFAILALRQLWPGKARPGR
jgi:glucoamylase